MVDIPISRALGVNPVSAWVESNLDALVKMYIPGIQEIEIRGKTIVGSEYTCMLTFLYDKSIYIATDKGTIYQNNGIIIEYANADGINVSSITPHKVFNGEKIEVRIVFYADKIDFDKRKSMAPKRTYKYSWEMAKGGMTRRRYNDGGGVPYKNLSLEKPQVIMDSNMDSENSIAEIELVKTKTIKIPAINTSGQITSSSDSAKLFRSLWHTDQMNIAEHFNVILLNRANKPIGYYQHSKGGIDGTVADIQLICASAVKSLSRGVLIAHNHPSGNLKPSQSDLLITRQLKDALALFKITLLDSMILVPNSMEYYSMLDEGIL